MPSCSSLEDGVLTPLSNPLVNPFRPRARFSPKAHCLCKFLAQCCWCWLSLFESLNKLEAPPGNPAVLHVVCYQALCRVGCSWRTTWRPPQAREWIGAEVPRGSPRQATWCLCGGWATSRYKWRRLPTVSPPAICRPLLCTFLWFSPLFAPPRVECDLCHPVGSELHHCTIGAYVRPCIHTA